MPSAHPVAVPLLTKVLIERIHKENLAQGKREKAGKSRFRCSDAGKCGRAISLSSLEIEETDPVDPPSEWVMWIGKEIGRLVAEAICDLWWDAEVEVPVTHGKLVSGFIDVLIKQKEPKRTIVYELKTMGGHAFGRSIGLVGYKQIPPEGPRTSAKLQASLYASAVQADLLIIGHIGLDALSKQRADKFDMGDLGRVMAEWHYTPEEFEPWAKQELMRLNVIRTLLDEGMLIEPSAVGDDGQTIKLDPNAPKPDWRCVYCSHRKLCSMLPTKAIPLRAIKEVQDTWL